MLEYGYYVLESTPVAEQKPEEPSKLAPILTCCALLSLLLLACICSGIIYIYAP